MPILSKTLGYDQASKDQENHHSGNENECDPDQVLGILEAVAHIG